MDSFTVATMDSFRMAVEASKWQRMLLNGKDRLQNGCKCFKRVRLGFKMATTKSFLRIKVVDAGDSFIKAVNS